jgi:hypothetical protein
VLLKRFLDFLVSPITAILNLSLSSGTFPSALKHASISPLLKKPNLDTDDPNSYRPVSNLPFLSKLIERAIFFQLSDHLARHDLLPDRQSAYRQNYSTETALLSLRDDLLRAADDGIGTAIVLLDLSAASYKITVDNIKKSKLNFQDTPIIKTMQSIRYLDKILRSTEHGICQEAFLSLHKKNAASIFFII